MQKIKGTAIYYSIADIAASLYNTHNSVIIYVSYRASCLPCIMTGYIMVKAATPHNAIEEKQRSSLA